MPSARACSASVSARYWAISASTGASPAMPAYSESRSGAGAGCRGPVVRAPTPGSHGPSSLADLAQNPRPGRLAQLPVRLARHHRPGYGATTCLRAALVFAFLAAVGAGLVATLPAPTALRLLPLLAVPVARARSGCSSSPPRWQTMPHKIRSRCSHSRPCCTLFTTASVRPQAWTPARTSRSAQPSRPAGHRAGPAPNGDSARHMNRWSLDPVTSWGARSLGRPLGGSLWDIGAGSSAGIDPEPPGGGIGAVRPS